VGKIQRLVGKAKELSGRKRMPEKSLRHLVNSFVNADSLRKGLILERHPELLTDAAERLLAEMAENAESEQLRRILEDHRTLLRRCRQIGIYKAFAELQSRYSPMASPPEGESEVGRPEESLHIPRGFQGDIQQWKHAEESFLKSPSLESLSAVLIALERIRNNPRFPRTSESFQAIIGNERGLVSHRYYQFRGDSGDLTAALHFWDEAIRLSPPPPLLPMCLNNLGIGLRERYHRNNDPEDLERAIEVFEEAIRFTPDGSLDLPARLGNLGNALRMRYFRNGDRDDLEQAVKGYEEAVRLTPASSPDLPIRLDLLGRGLVARYRATGDQNDLTQAVKSGEQAVLLARPQSPDLPFFLAGLGSSLLACYEHNNDAADLQRSIELLEEAVQLNPGVWSDLPLCLSDLGAALNYRYFRTSQLKDLRRAIEVHEKAVELTPAPSTELALHLTNLSQSLRALYDHTGSVDELERLIEVCREAVEQTPPDSPLLPERLTNLGIGLSERHARTADARDLDRAIEVYEEALSKPAAADGPVRSIILANLGTDLQERSKHTGNLEDLHRAIEHYEAAIQLAPVNSPTRALYLNNVSGGFIHRYSLTRNPGDLHRSIAAGEKAIERTPPESPSSVLFLMNLGAKLHLLYEHTNDLEHLQRATSLCEEAVDRTPLNHPHRPFRLGSLGETFVERYERSHRPEDLKQAVEVYDEALAISRQSVALSPLIYQVGQQTRQLGVHIGAALAYLHGATAWPNEARDWLTKALLAVEASKSRFLTNLLSRGPVPGPSTIPSELVEREQALTQELARLDAVALAHHSRPMPQRVIPNRREDLHRWAQRKRALEAVWQEMEGYDSADSYLALRRGDPLSRDAVAQLAADFGQETALLSLAIAPERTLLFGLRPGWEAPRLVEVPLRVEENQRLMQRFFREIHAFDGTGRRGETWYRPLLALLEQMRPHLIGVRHAVLAPHLGGHLLPWGMLASQAQWEPAVVTVPSLGVLRHIPRRPPIPIVKPNALVVGNPTGDLPYAQREALEVAESLDAEPLIGPMARKAVVLRHLELGEVQLAHFATHASFAPGSPLDSGIVLADGVLTAREILEQGVQAPEFMILSACQTGMAGALSGDEMAGLTQALLYAGARSLLVSLWEVNDPATAYLMSRFYQGWGKGLDKAVALQSAMEEVRQASTDWAHTYYWGAFVLVGDWR
jgi:tetratricopeptide (TPR) repeat protein